DLPPSLGDPDRLAQVIANLVSNAIKFSPPGSVVGIRTRQVMRRQLLEVADSGPGIPQEEMPLLFQEFARLSPQPTGGEKSSGVGLSIAKHLVELHGGKIGARSKVGHGSLFWVELPIQPVSEPQT
ncbi:MAG TPA: ATP-binding protein, partial [Aggregatilineales bacterium]|nr:ATP-binding protein [Aggregatilineales bacterium]